MENENFNLDNTNYFLPNEDMFSNFLNTNETNKINMYIFK